MNGHFLINRPKAKVMGVCAGLADWLAIDVLAVRLVAVVALLVVPPITLLLYIVTGWLAAEER